MREDNDLTMSDGFSLLLIFLSSSLDVPDEERLLFDIVLSLVVSGFIWPSGAVAAVAIVSTVSLDNILDELSSCKSSSSISKGEALLLAVVNPRLYTIGDRTTPILDWCNMLVVYEIYTDTLEVIRYYDYVASYYDCSNILKFNRFMDDIR